VVTFGAIGEHVKPLNLRPPAYPSHPEEIRASALAPSVTTQVRSEREPKSPFLRMILSSLSVPMPLLKSLFILPFYFSQSLWNIDQLYPVIRIVTKTIKWLHSFCWQQNLLCKFKIWQFSLFIHNNVSWTQSTVYVTCNMLSCMKLLTNFHQYGQKSKIIKVPNRLTS
jgi:hypothetical protein